MNRKVTLKFEDKSVDTSFKKCRHFKKEGLSCVEPYDTYVALCEPKLNRLNRINPKMSTTK